MYSLRAMEAALVPDPRRWRALALVCVAFFMVVLDVSIVNVALPSIASDLKLSPSTLQWIITAYSLAFGGFLLLGGAPRTCSAGGASSSPGWPCSRSARSCAASRRAAHG
jgi:hypothetical protein